MFKFLKEKLGKVTKSFSKQVEEEADIERIEEEIEQEEIKEEPKQKVREEKPEDERVQEKEDIPKEKETSEKKEDVFKKEESTEEPEEKPKKKDISKQKGTETKEVKAHEEEPEEKESFEEIKEKKEKRFLGIFKKKPKEDRSSEVDKEDSKPKEEKLTETEETVQEKEETKQEPEQELKEEKEGTKEKTEGTPAEEKKKSSIFTKVSDTFTKINLSEEKFENLFWDIEITLLENNVAVEVIELIKNNLKQELCTGKQSRKNIQQIIKDSLKESIKESLDVKTIDLETEIKNKKPYIIAVIGINGAGKTTAIAKLTHKLKAEGKKIVWAAADTFRAAAIQQLEEHANKLDVKLIKHDYNSDPAAVAFDAVKHAKAKDYDVVLIDTAGRMHSNDNLMQELKKLIRVNNPDMKLYIGESITGNDCVEQARIYDEQIGIDAIILTKADIDEKGGAPLSISYVTKKPILFLGTGQEYKDLEPFSKQKIIDSLGL